MRKDLLNFAALRSRQSTWLLLLDAAVALLVVVCLRLPAASRRGYGALGSHDFIEYWNTARLLTQGGNPYGPGLWLSDEKAEGWDELEPLQLASALLATPSRKGL